MTQITHTFSDGTEETRRVPRAHFDVITDYRRSGFMAGAPVQIIIVGGYIIPRGGSITLEAL
jgi:hypothetical protein